MNELNWNIDKSSINSAKAVMEYNKSKEEVLKKEEYYKNKPINQNDIIIERLKRTEIAINEMKEIVRKPKKIDWAILVMSIISVIIATLQLMK